MYSIKSDKIYKDTEPSTRPAFQTEPFTRVIRYLQSEN